MIFEASRAKALNQLNNFVENNLGEYSHGVTYKTGDVVKYGGNSYVSRTNHINQYPTDTDGALNSANWDLNVKGFDYQSGGYQASTTYNIGDVVRYLSSTIVDVTSENVPSG